MKNNEALDAGTTNFLASLGIEVETSAPAPRICTECRDRIAVTCSPEHTTCHLCRPAAPTTPNATTGMLNVRVRDLDDAPTTPTFDEALASFVASVNDMRAEYYAATYDNIPASDVEEVTVAPRGRKYAKLVKRGSVYCFVNRENGDILMAASWKAPAKHARGNIFSANPLAAVGPHGANYLV